MLAVSQLAKLGHRRIALAQWHEQDLNTWLLQGYREGLRLAGLPRRRNWEQFVPITPAGGEQVVAANVGVLFIVMALDADFSLRRLERYLLLSRESGASPVVLLTKPDLTDDPAGRRAEVQTVAGNAPVHVISPLNGDGMERVSRYLPRGYTGALVGSSGVGKTTIINRLMGTDARKTLRELIGDIAGLKVGKDQCIGSAFNRAGRRLGLGNIGNQCRVRLKFAIHNQFRIPRFDRRHCFADPLQ